MSEGEERVARAIALLESQHRFPGPFEFRVVVRPAHRSAAVAALLAAAGGSHTLLEVGERPSAKGTYLALRVKVEAEAASRVLEIYEVLRRVEGVITVL